MHYLILVIGGLIGLSVHHVYTRKTTKECPHCAERIKKKAVFCRFCNQSLISPVESFSQRIQRISQNIVDDNLKKMSAIVSLSVTKKFLEAQIFVTQGLKLLAQNKTKK